MADGLDDRGDQAAADRLDRDITAVLTGVPARRTDPTLLWLAAVVRSEPPASLHRRLARRVEAAEARRWRPTQLVAALLASVLFANGLGNVFNNDWVAESIGEANSPHAWIEGGVALLALSVVIGLAVFSRRAIPYAVAGGAPAGLVYGVRSFDELGQFTGGFVLHLSQGVLGIALFVLWWRARRYGSSGGDEGGA